MDSSDAQTASPTPTHLPNTIVDIDPKGDVILDVLFQNSEDTLNVARRAELGVRRQNSSSRPVLKKSFRVCYRVSRSVLEQQSKYFKRLLGGGPFREAQSVHDCLEALRASGRDVAECRPSELPSVRITEDDESTRSAGREAALGDLLRVLHSNQVSRKPPTVNMAYVAVLTVLADRFDCTSALSRSLTTKLKFKWPVTSSAQHANRQVEETLRQKILVSWLLEKPPILVNSTRELVLQGSKRWGPFSENADVDRASWWDLPDGLESELNYRRHCVLNTIASVQAHFLRLYSSRARQCRLGYESSASCDSFQLGEMVKFLANKSLLSLVDYSPASLDQMPDLDIMSVDTLLATLKMCPAYQIDKHHTNCGLRTRILPILEFIQAMLSTDVVAIDSRSWKADRKSTAWSTLDDETHVFAFTRAMAGDQRLRHENPLAAGKVARQLFTATSWHWTPEDDSPSLEDSPMMTSLETSLRRAK